MKTNRQLGKWLTLGLLTMLIATAILSWAGQARELVGRSFQDTEQFYHTVEYEILDRLAALSIEPVTKEELMESYTVTINDIEEYRFRYGNLNTQIANIQDQYATSEGEELSEELAAERDEKIADIRKNFNDDAYVEEKLIAEWERLVDRYMMELQQRKNEFSMQYPGIAYSLTNTATEETFEKGNTTSDAYKVNYGSNGRWLQGARMIDQTDSAYDILNRIGSLHANYNGTVYIPQSYIGPALEEYKNKQIVFWILTILGIVAAAAWYWVWRRWKKDLLSSSVLTTIDTQSQELRALIIGGLFATSYITLSEITRGMFYYYGADDFTVFASLFVIALITVLMMYIASSIRTYDDYTYHNSPLHRGIESFKGLFLNRSLIWQVIYMAIVVFFWGLGTALVAVAPEMISVWIVCTLFIGLPVVYFLFSRLAYLNRTMERTSLLTAGVTTQPFEIRGRSRLTQHAKELNSIRDQLVSSQSSQVKSERLKSELITNVSHDLRTPLTSIITYTDLLKNPDLTQEQRAQYVDVLERKSARLKTLIEDLFDVSKMASGNIELQIAQVDLASLLQQAIAEQQEALEKQNLDLRVAIGSQPIHALVDGQKMWRVMDNLLINISKYAMPGTRVYVALHDAGSEAVLSFKNVSQYELGDDTAELTERFKRGDQARHTEGSGLGLAIAQSIVALHHGQFDLDLDGDLFKVTIRIPKGAQV